MTTELTGGIDPSREYVFAQRPDNSEMRDSVSFWTVDDRGRFGLPRIGIEAVAAGVVDVVGIRPVGGEIALREHS